MSRLIGFLHRALHPDRGQMMIMFAVIFTITMVMGVLTVDIGLWLSERRAVVKAADLAALAGSQDLPDDDDAAIQSALHWAELNGFEDGVDGVTVTVDLFCSNGLTQSVSGICRNPHPPDPVPCGSPPWIMKSLITLWNVSPS